MTLAQEKRKMYLVFGAEAQLTGSQNKRSTGLIFFTMSLLKLKATRRTFGTAPSLCRDSDMVKQVSFVLEKRGIQIL